MAAFAFCFLSLSSHAQIFTAKAGFNLATTKEENNTGALSGESKMIPGFHLGMMAEFPLDKKFSIETGLMFNNRGVRYTNSAYDAKYATNLYYLDLPVTGKYSHKVGKYTKIFAAAGPYMALGLFTLQHSKFTANGVTEKDTDFVKWKNTSLKRFDAGATFGAGVEHKKMQYGVSYDLGLTNLADFTDYSSKNRVLRFSVGYRFSRK